MTFSEWGLIFIVGIVGLSLIEIPTLRLSCGRSLKRKWKGLDACPTSSISFLKGRWFWLHLNTFIHQEKEAMERDIFLLFILIFCFPLWFFLFMRLDRQRHARQPVRSLSKRRGEETLVTFYSEYTHSLESLNMKNNQGRKNYYYLKKNNISSYFLSMFIKYEAERRSLNKIATEKWKLKKKKKCSRGYVEVNCTLYRLFTKLHMNISFRVVKKNDQKAK